MPSLKTILILSFTDLARDPRIRRQIAFLKGHYRIVTAACGAPDDAGVEYISLKPWRRRNRGVIRRCVHAVGRLTGWYRLTHARDARLTPELLDFICRPLDLIIANDIETMHLAVEISRMSGAPILLDAHEMEPWHRSLSYGGCGRAVRGAQWFCSTYIPQAKQMVTVSNSIAEHYTREYGLSCEVITNAPFYVEQSPTPVQIGAIRLVHHGGTNASRNLDDMFQLMAELDARFSLDLFLVPNNPAVYESLREKAATHPRVRLLPPVPVDEISRQLNQYDMGIYMLNSSVQNQKLALPNKIFEFVQARLGVATWPTPEMARLVRDHGLGVVASEYSVAAMAKALNALRPEDVVRFKQASHAAARTLSAEVNRERMLRIVDEMLMDPIREKRST